MDVVPNTMEPPPDRTQDRPPSPTSTAAISVWHFIWLLSSYFASQDGGGSRLAAGVPKRSIDSFLVLFQRWRPLPSTWKKHQYWEHLARLEG